jgi:hypothetical protein
MENEMMSLGMCLAFMMIVIGLLMLGHAIFTVLCRTCRPFAEWAARGADELEDCQCRYEDCGDGCVYVWELEEEEA